MSRKLSVLGVALALVGATLGWVVLLRGSEIPYLSDRTAEPFPKFTPAAPPAIRSDFGSSGEIGQLQFDAIGAAAPMYWTQVDDGTLAVPSDVATVGLWNAGALPSDAIGAMVIAGHITDNDGHPGSLARLTDASVGDVIKVRSSSSTYQYEVVEVRQYHKEELPAELFDQTQPHRLHLVSCANRVGSSSGGFHYTDNVIVSAELLEGDIPKKAQ